jgi:hypothetical protein
MPNPASLSCLYRPYSCKSSQKGGTLLADTVLELVDHVRILCDPDGYRPSSCPTCEFGFMHAHDFRVRRLRGDPEASSIEVRRYRCPHCGAVWQVLPGLLARHLHRRWPVVQAAMEKEGVVEPGGKQALVNLPGATLRRWRARLTSASDRLLKTIRGAVTDLAFWQKRQMSGLSIAGLLDSLVSHGFLHLEHRFTQFACWIHRVIPGVRFM